MCVGRGVASQSEPSECHTGFHMSGFSLACLDSLPSPFPSPSYPFSPTSLFSLFSFFFSPFFPIQSNFIPLPGTDSDMRSCKPIWPHRGKRRLTCASAKEKPVFFRN